MNAPPASAQRPVAARPLDAWETDMPTDRSHGGDGWFCDGALPSRAAPIPVIRVMSETCYKQCGR